MNKPLKSLEAIVAELEGYDPQALQADRVGEFLSQLVNPVTEQETPGYFSGP